MHPEWDNQMENGAFFFARCGRTCVVSPHPWFQESTRELRLKFLGNLSRLDLQLHTTILWLLGRNPVNARWGEDTRLLQHVEYRGFYRTLFHQRGHSLHFVMYNQWIFSPIRPINGRHFSTISFGQRIRLDALIQSYSFLDTIVGWNPEWHKILHAAPRGWHLAFHLPHPYRKLELDTLLRLKQMGVNHLGIVFYILDNAWRVPIGWLGEYWGLQCLAKHWRGLKCRES